MDRDEGVHNELFEAHTHSFVIKLWLEETADEAERSVWRGHIDHVPSGKRRYIANLEDVPLFMMPYLQEMQVETGLCWRMRNWLMNRKALQRAEA